MKIIMLFGRWKGFWRSNCVECGQRFYCRDRKVIVCEPCSYEIEYELKYNKPIGGGQY